MKKVVINSSGGGSDFGLVGNGITEKNMTLDISNIIKQNLEDKGVEVFMLRNGDETISYDDRIKKIKNRFGTDKDIIVLSNTLNSGGGSGIEVIYALKNKDTLAKALENNLEYFNDTKHYQLRWPTDTAKDYYYITRNTPEYETIIIRYGYVDNPKDANILKNDYQKIATAVSDAILDYVGIPSLNTYIVKSGDTLYSIAKKYNTSVNDFKTLNNLTSNNLSIGQALKIPTASETKPDVNINYYKVVSGDTLYSIARRFNISVEKLKDINNLKSNTISIGQLLKINNYDSYIVKAGDTLYSIAKKYNTSVDDLMNINNLKSSNLSIGQVLYIL